VLRMNAASANDLLLLQVEWVLLRLSGDLVLGEDIVLTDEILLGDRVLAL